MRLKSFLVVLLSFCFAFSSATTNLKKVDVKSIDSGERLVFTLSSPTTYDIFNTEKSSVVTVELKSAAIEKNINLHDLPINIKVQEFNNKLRLIIDFKQCVLPKKARLEKDVNGNTLLIVDLDNCNLEHIKGHVLDVNLLDKLRNTEDLVIAIDAGRGGSDHGTVGKKGTKEKDITLDIAKRLAALINKKRNMHAVLIRQNDENIELKDRARIASMYKADILVSINANSNEDSKVKGTGVFVFSKSGAGNKVTQLISEHNNSTDISKHDVIPADMLYDIANNKSIARSTELGENILLYLKRVGKLHKDYVEQGSFVILSESTMPSVMVEVGFLSNSETEAKLSSRKHRSNLAKAIFNGIQKYYGDNKDIKLKNSSASGFTRRIHRVKKGDTLSSLSEKYDVSVKAIKEVNKLQGNKIRIGTKLVIPTSF